MSGARTIETTQGVDVLYVRLCDGEQVLAERTLSPFSAEDLMDWKLARSEMMIHHLVVTDPPRPEPGEPTAEDYFNAAVNVLFPEFGTVPDGVETT